MKETKKNLDNNQHLYGFINDVRINKTESGRTAINLDVVTLETYKDKEGKTQNRRTNHDATLFTDDKETVAKFEAIAKDVKANRENRGVEAYKPVTHTISLDGILVNRENKFKDSDKTYNSVAVLVNEKSVDLDVKQAENEKRNRADFAANIADINVFEDHKFAVVKVGSNFHPKEGKSQTTWLDVRVNGNSPYSKKTYEDIVAGKVEKGDFVRIGGQLRDNTVDTAYGKRFGNAIDLTSFEMLKRKADMTQKKEAAAKTEVKAAPKKKAASKKAAAVQKL